MATDKFFSNDDEEAKCSTQRGIGGGRGRRRRPTVAAAAATATFAVQQDRSADLVAPGFTSIVLVRGEELDDQQPREVERGPPDVGAAERSKNAAIDVAVTRRRRQQREVSIILDAALKIVDEDDFLDDLTPYPKRGRFQ